MKKSLIDLSSLVIWFLVIILINTVSGYFFARFDLTQEKRYTLSEATTDQLENLEDVVFIRVYLEGNLPTEFRELHDATKELLDEFRAYGGMNIEYEFINPSISPDEKERVEVYKELTRQGLQYTNIRMQAGDKTSEQIVFPGAIISFHGREVPIQILKSVAGATEQEMIAASIQQLEYEFVSAIRRVNQATKKSVAFIGGHGELSELETADAKRALEEFYEVERVTLDQKVNALDGFDAIIIARPDSAYSEQDKFIIDQFIMNGGKSLWMIDPVFARMDSLRTSNLTMGLKLEHNLDDQLFKYGVRLNADLVMDIQCINKPIVTGYIGNQPRQEMFPWYYEPLLSGNQEHPISANIERVKTEFVSTMEAIEVDSVSSTPLLLTSDQCRTVKVPTRISFNILRDPPKYEMFTDGPLPTALLLEGKFPSVFTNRLPKRLLADEGLKFKERSVDTKMIVVSDGDIIRNPVSLSDQKFYALGFDKYTQTLYGNRAFVLNSMNYLCDDSGLLNVRSKEFKIRLLNQAKIESERYYWQVLNTAAPLVIVLLMGIGFYYWRKRRFVF
ncbi:gliding motility-associated ABC transporter substrate-binding protein GldG [Salibacteraceae bacterium]|nr:gliding motility-associated ABC transporter substrate-binding protein GldG [Flavobacteriales bacterium]MDB9701364.1 gliding motility-associated ABC transporter substrate-binding protein GldG [Salibacteraceae bacterium]